MHAWLATTTAAFSHGQRGGAYPPQNAAGVSKNLCRPDQLLLLLLLLQVLLSLLKLLVLVVESGCESRRCCEDAVLRGGVQQGVLRGALLQGVEFRRDVVDAAGEPGLAAAGGDGEVNGGVQLDHRLLTGVGVP